MTTASHPVSLDRLRARLASLDHVSLDATALGALLGDLVREGLASLPRPGNGCTLQRWQALETVAAFDLSLAKLYEGHTDATGIMDELGVDPVPSDATWGMWAAEAPDARVIAHEDGPGRLRLVGTKAWCSGAAHLTHALLTVWTPAREGPLLAAIELDQPGVSFVRAPWHAVGMAASGSIDVRFEHASARVVGSIGDYLSRCGFWQGGAGIAACWHGGAVGIAQSLEAAARRDESRAWHRLAALGHVDTLLTANAALLRESAAWIDAHPQADARAVALRTRAAADATATAVLAHAGRALGAAPFCRDASFARRAADLPVFIRQSHAERDLVALGTVLVESPEVAWTL